MKEPEKQVHYAPDGKRPIMEGCRGKGGFIARDAAMVTCPKCRGAAGLDGASAARNRVRKGFLTRAQTKALLLAAATVKAKAAFSVAYYCALRASEVGLLQVDRLDAKKRLLDVQRLKGSLGMVYPVAPIWDALGPWLKQRPKSPWLFPEDRDDTRPLDRRRFYRWMVAAGEKAGIPRGLCHPHVLKHSIATHLMDRPNPDLAQIKEWLGHKRIESTLVYAEVTGRAQLQGEEVAKGLASELLGEDTEGGDGHG